MLPMNISLSFKTADDTVDSISRPHPVHSFDLQHPNFTEEQSDLSVLRKIQTQAIIARILLGSFLGIVIAYYECYWSAAATGGLVVVNVIALPILWLTKHTGFARGLAAHGTCVFLLAILWAFGGGPGSAGVIALAYMEQIQHRVEVPSSRASSWWVAVIVVCSLVLCIVERTVDPQYVTPQQARLPPTWYAIFFWFGTNWPGIMLYIVLSQLMEELHKSRRLLEASKAEADRLNQELLQQQHKLKVERSLAHGLISNVFPRGISASLIELFERYSHHPEHLEPMEMLHSKLQAVSVLSESPHSPQEDQPLPGRDSLSSISITPEMSPCMSQDETLRSTRQSLHALVGRSLAPCKRRAVIMFGDIVGFTATASRIEAATLVEYLDCFFGQVDELCEEHGVEKIKTIGDCYMCVGFADEATTQRLALSRVLLVADGLHDIAARTPLEGKPMRVRVGVHVGTVLTGIIGKTKFAFDVWGDAVNVASRMESTGVPGTTQITADAYALLEDKTAYVQRGPVDVKGKGKLATYCNTGWRRAVPRAAAVAPAGSSYAVQRLASLLLTAKGGSPSPPSSPIRGFSDHPSFE